jgi:glycosyltransferase involved in cell wall biosynthesis
MNNRVLLIYAKGVNELFNRQSALGSYIHCLCMVLEKYGMQVYVNGTLFIELNKAYEAKVNVVSSSNKSIAKLLPGIIKRPVKFYRELKNIQRLRNMLLNFDRYDVILEFYTCASDIGSVLSIKHKKPLVVLYDSPVQDEYTFFNGRTFFIHWFIGVRERKSLMAAKSIVVYSNAVKNYLNQKLKKNLPVCIHQNVDYTRFDFIFEKEPSETVNIGFIGSFLKWHRVDLLVNVFMRFKNEGKNVKLILLGNGLEFQNIRQRIEDLGMMDEIEMPGFVDGMELLEYKHKMHIGIMPGSNWYGAPNKIFEYGAAGLAVVAPDTPTIKDLFGSEHEILLFKQDVETELYEKLNMYIENPDLIRQHAINLQNKIKSTYNEEITWNFYHGLLN